MQNVSQAVFCDGGVGARVFVFFYLIFVSRIIETWALLAKKKKEKLLKPGKCKDKTQTGCLKLSKSLQTHETEVLLTQKSVSRRIPREFIKVFSKHLCPLDTFYPGPLLSCSQIAEQLRTSVWNK